MDQIAYYDYPYDLQAVYSQNSNVIEKAGAKAAALSEKYGQEIERLDYYEAVKLDCGRREGSNAFVSAAGFDFADQFAVTLLIITGWKERAKAWKKAKSCCILPVRNLVLTV